ncbi:nascent polypeptide-associated complex protein [Candidatus Woesearchaeota archaeon CG10_big_fil_rev_8_21_14_0_10_34_12]|nr:MAG: nascent polypeptide-associated complex protein [Candidatus Woesearchaeota archaeon CG10_big_fil_rev_8_21_14_0_10_34_12]
MFGGIPGMNPKKMQEMMKQLGIKQQEIDAERVIIEKKDGKKLVIENPGIVKINMQGNETLQISGEIEEVEEGINKEDIQMVAEKSGKSEEEARKALEESGGDLAEAIMKLQ